MSLRYTLVRGTPVLPNLPPWLAATQGNHYYVKPGSGNDSRHGRDPDHALKTLTKAQALMSADKNDICFLMSESNTAAQTTSYQSSALSWAKDGCHLIGIGAGSMIGSRARISNLSSATAIVNGLVVLSANNCYIANVGIFHGKGGTNPTGASIALSVTGQRNRIENCQISGIGDAELDDANSRSLKVSGSENHFKGCYIGLDTTIRGTAAAEVEVADGAARTIFEDCFFDTYTSADGFLMVKYSAPDRFILFKNCIFNAVNNITSAEPPAAALSAATSVNGQILLHGTVAYGFDNICAADDAKVLIGSYAKAGVDAALAAGVDVS